MPAMTPVPGTSETMPDMGTAMAGAGGAGGVQDPSGQQVTNQALQERTQGVSRILNKVAATVAEHAQGLGTIATQFPSSSKRLKTAIDHLEKAQQDIVTAITDIVRESQQADQMNTPPVVR